MSRRKVSPSESPAPRRARAKVTPITAKLPQGALPEDPTLDDLIGAFKRSRSEYDELRRRFHARTGVIREAYVAKHLHAGAVILKPRGLVASLTQQRKLYLRYDGTAAASVQPEFEAAIWRTRRMERESGLILGGRSRKVLLEMLYSVVVYLLGVLDATAPMTPEGCDERAQRNRRRRVSTAIASATEELDRLQEFATEAARRASLRWYLLGLPLGALVAGVIIAVADNWSTSLTETPTQAARLCFSAGAIGGIVSVMARITHRRRLDIDSQQGQAVTILAGAFRPLIGAVFGLALYAFVKGGLVPVAIPDDGTAESLFFASLAFLAGFSERWAQDTIVRSTPVVSLQSVKPGAPRLGITPSEDPANPG